MKKRYVVVSAIVLLLVALFALAAFATQAEIYFSSDSSGANRVTNVQEGDQVWICVYDPDENIDCDVRDKIWTDIKVMDPKTGAYIVWLSYNKDEDTLHYKGHYPGNPGSTNYDYLGETGANTGLFVSSRPFQIGGRESYDTATKSTHVVDSTWTGATPQPDEFQWGNYLYAVNSGKSQRGWVQGDGSINFLASNSTPSGNAVKPSELAGGKSGYLIGRFENMDTIVGMYQDQNDPTDVAVGMMKIKDTQSKISWDEQYYDGNGAATITVTDLDENLNSNKVEYVPVFILVNPGSWNIDQTHSVTVNSFCSLKRNGGYSDTSGTSASQIRWYNIYNDRYIRYPQSGDGNVVSFDVTQTYSRVVFYAKETGTNTGVFQLNINDILGELGFRSLQVNDVLAAYYLDPNDEDDFSIATAYIGTSGEANNHSITSFTDASRNPKSEFWLGRDPMYVQVIDSNANVDSCCPEQVVVHICDPHEEDDSEYVIADETSSNSPVFFTHAGIQLLPVWDALGNANPGKGGYQLVLNNWKIEAFNEDTVYARYNDVYYTDDSMAKLGDGLASDIPPTIRSDGVRVANDVSFAQAKIGDTQVYDGSQVNMYFLDRQGNRVSDYVNSDCVFVEVVDPDQNEDQYRRERINGYWDEHQNYPFGPEENPSGSHAVNNLLGLDNIFSDTSTNAKLYILNPRNGKWAAVDLLETGVATGDFVSVTCIDLASQYTGVPTLGVKPGDTIIAVYQDPSNHSDSAWISIKVGSGGAVTPPSQKSTTTFADSAGNSVTQYYDTDNVYVKVKDPSHAGATQLLGAVTIGTNTFDLHKLAGTSDTFITDPITMSDIGASAGDTITATYTDPTDPTDTSDATATVVASTLNVTSFYADPNPFSTTTTFSYEGTGIANTFSVSVYDLAGHLVWSKEAANVSEITWDGTSNGVKLASGPYVYVAVLTGPDGSGGTKTLTFKGTLGIER